MQSECVWHSSFVRREAIADLAKALNQSLQETPGEAWGGPCSAALGSSKLLFGQRKRKEEEK